MIFRTTNQPTKMAAESPTSTQGTKVVEMVKSKGEELRIEKQERGKRKRTTKKKEQEESKMINQVVVDMSSCTSP